MKRSGFNNKRKYVFLHESNPNADGPSFSYIVKVNKYHHIDKTKTEGKSYQYVVKNNKPRVDQNIVTFFVSFNKLI